MSQSQHGELAAWLRGHKHRRTLWMVGLGSGHVAWVLIEGFDIFVGIYKNNDLII
jgi:hypothetical protein